MVHVKERGGGGEERKVSSLPLPPLSFFGSRFISRAVKTENPVSPFFFFRSETKRKTLATQATIQTKLIFN